MPYILLSPVVPIPYLQCDPSTSGSLPVSGSIYSMYDASLVNILEILINYSRTLVAKVIGEVLLRSPCRHTWHIEIS